jgi:hypothetical protein
MIPNEKLEKFKARDQRRHRETLKRIKKRTYIIFSSSALFHLVMALILSSVAIVQPKMAFPFRLYDRSRSYDTILLEEPLPELKPLERIQSTKIENTVNITMNKRERQEIIQKSVPQKETLTSWEKALLAKQGKPGQGTSGDPGLKGTRGNPGDRPGMTSAGGIVNDKLITKTGGTGLKTDKAVPLSVIPAGNGNTIGAGGKGISGFQYGATETGRGSGRIDLPGRGGSGGTKGKGESGPGQGLGTGTGSGKGSGGKGTTGIGLGDGTGTGGMGTGTGGTGTGKSGIGEGGPGTVGTGIDAPRSNPNLITKGSGNDNIKDSPKKNSTIDDKRAVVGKDGFKADLGKDMSNARTNPTDKTNDRDYGDALQEEINKDLNSLRKLYEDWQNSKIPDIPKTMQITVALNMESKEARVSSIDFHNAALSSKIRDDLTKRIKSWKFKSLYDGKDDPTKWPLKLNGKISWQ